ncbi:hypothetical protein KIN20_035952 [Parelaphostrongylus tenuis]|uniref:Uncharacterized protein n=1 Tax=Parelaphostrongylus tenuis TaxID=148309 RepID=A0AAD5WKY9_PARTN|nr:hypothetical protein KIN20_035952 [Parelaphostrongylus tenuis]
MTTTEHRLGSVSLAKDEALRNIIPTTLSLRQVCETASNNSLAVKDSFSNNDAINH